MKTTDVDLSPPAPAGLRASMRRAVPSGLVAGGFAAAAAAAASADEKGAPFAPINAVTHSLWPRRALHERGFSMRHTLMGFAIHQAAAVFWAVLFETLVERIAGARPQRLPAAAAGAAAATALTAYVVDYKVVPARLTPGFEAHLSDRSLGAVYVALGCGLLAAALLRRR
ncbi:hypothetical protein LJ655_10445 [Paraburkholderia sp. MMS20-SJTN17]|uniref:DUF1440 domain-containing protein n=1 Tax=Paraburkholderia translucens TaxID=2886945 RepID=A0ABS8KC14_9BURK|nr:hypothetical protein [Paraburkholderia sp. MMS20-SJTN17]MCC8402306.1 hypothetical protein [Paraburkholderia sp. MMS20-SJTN17]